MAKIKRCVGQFYECRDSYGDHWTGLVAQFAPNMVALICLKEGNRFVDAVHVMDTCDLTPAEWAAVTGQDTGSMVSMKLLKPALTPMIPVL